MSICPRFHINLLTYANKYVGALGLFYMQNVALHCIIILFNISRIESWNSDWFLNYFNWVPKYSSNIQNYLVL